MVAAVWSRSRAVVRLRAWSRALFRLGFGGIPSELRGFTYTSQSLTSSTATRILTSSFFDRIDRRTNLLIKDVRLMREAPLGPHPGFSPPIEASHWLELEPTTPDKWVRRGSLFEALGRAFDHSSWLLLVVGAILVYTGKRRRDEGIKNFPFTSISFLTQHPMPRPSTPYPVVIRA
ncbi:hypothetical protein PGTUg99_036472 [Puccinia graminis f. sp. tritici]|uniref:Uncharacterized protein n=1 Tax=Puccinia graminis f. sp. tritici TaxID=56615 RepID=A0A5B0S216_PUCGR|nr:hypothetical protein PGTUg99_036472 [Puccinia graminis f. sp. tritici]